MLIELTALNCITFVIQKGKPTKQKIMRVQKAKVYSREEIEVSLFVAALLIAIILPIILQH